jgi:hypothetical protein
MIKLQTRVYSKYFELKILLDGTTIDLGWYDKKQAKELRDSLLSVTEDIEVFVNEVALESAVKGGE